MMITFEQFVAEQSKHLYDELEKLIGLTTNPPGKLTSDDKKILEIVEKLKVMLEESYGYIGVEKK